MSEALWTAEEVASAVGAAAPPGCGDLTGVCFDSREVEPGDLFFALKGARDGHAFIPQALARGAAAVVASTPCEGPAFQVEDTEKALVALAAAARDRAPEIRRGAVTGSVGKTSVVQAIAAGLRLAGPAHAPVKSFNNHIGVPLTLTRMRRDSARAVFEIGMNHAEEIRPLTRLVQPQAVCITNVGAVHTENFADGEAGVARAKAEILDGLGPGGAAILNQDNDWFDFLKSEALTRGARVLGFGSDETADGRLLDYQADGDGARISVRLYGHDYVFRMAVPGFHWGLNSLATLMMLDALDVPVETGLQALAEFQPLAGRGQARRIGLDGGAGHFLLVDESYNANPISMRATLATLRTRGLGEGGRRIVVLTDMLELGEEAPRMHAALAQDIEEAGVDLVFLAGPLMKNLWDVLPNRLRGAYAQDAVTLAPVAAEAVRDGDVVMVKGSNGSKASLAAAALASLGDAHDKRA